jgi:hypothetical protein
VRKISPSPGFDPRTGQPVAQWLYRLSYPTHKTGQGKDRNKNSFTFNLGTQGNALCKKKERKETKIFRFFTDE